MQSYLYEDDVQSEEQSRCVVYQSEQEYWNEKFEIEQQLKQMGFHK